MESFVAALMVLMENGRMDSNLQVMDSHIITELGNKSAKCRLSDGSESSVTFENLDDGSADMFSNCNGNSTSSDELPSLMNGIKICNNHDGNSYNSNSNGSNSSQCSLNSVQKTINSSLENSLSNLSIKADYEEVSLKFTESSCVNCDNSSPNNDCSAEFNQEIQSVNENEPKTEICCTSAITVRDDAQSSQKSEKEEEDRISSEIVYICYESEEQMPDIMKLIQKDLSEPYSIYTYRYFIHNWPHLCFLVSKPCFLKFLVSKITTIILMKNFLSFITGFIQRKKRRSHCL